MAVEKVRKILYLVPDAIFRNYNDEIVEWLDPRTEPTQTQIDAITDQQVIDSELEEEATKSLEVARKDRLIFEINYDQESRARVLESRPTITKQQYKDALIAQY